MSWTAYRRLAAETLPFHLRVIEQSMDAPHPGPARHDSPHHSHKSSDLRDAKTIRMGGVNLPLVLIFILSGCSMIQDAAFHEQPHPTPPDHTIHAVIERLRPAVEHVLDPAAQEPRIARSATRSAVHTFPVQYPHQAVVDTLTQPWDGLMKWEARGRHIARSATQGMIGLPTLLTALMHDGDPISSPVYLPPVPTEHTPQNTLAFMTETIRLASVHRDQALAALSEQERQFLYRHGHVLAERFTPQISVLSMQAKNEIEATTQFAELLNTKFGMHHLITAATLLSHLTHDEWLANLSLVFPDTIPEADLPTGITGDVRLIHDTPDGAIIIGGPGPNTYHLNEHIALLIDLGGNDSYHGMIASSADDTHGNAVVIDLAGNDTYDGAPLGLATGRLGVGLLFDRSGNDTYRLQMGSGGAGFGGLGILFDVQGHDEYLGERFTQGTAIGGLGLLVDGSGNDRYTSHGYGIGFGGPLGVGTLIDVSGNDFYACGNAIPSAYNAQDAPGGKPGDPLFQYDCFGLGTGAGSRILTHQRDWRAKSLAGGWGFLADLDGNDQYTSANFSQGMGYFFGAGVLFDAHGHDRYAAARYGHGASAHYGVALFIDHHGNDRYHSTGPYYNAGVAWDHGVSLAIDAGDGHDIYAFDRTTGLGKADHTGWAVFIDERGDDRYTIRSGFGEGAKESFAGFIDLDGHDTYNVLTPLFDNHHPRNGATLSPATGSIFVDR
ncbi:MAG: hypothetical protein OEY86_06530 [Nitrospira sp.]|nr:hypothetical protein [Nitrospira sp.]